MSTRETQLLNDLGIKRVTVADAIKVSRAAVTRGLNGEKHYLGPERLVMLVEHLQALGSTKRARAVAAKGKEWHSELFESLLRAPRRDEKNSPVDSQVSHSLWVISPSPLEIEERGYLETMFDNQLIAAGGREKRRSYVYFVPKSVAGRLKARYLALRGERENGSRSFHQFIIVVCPAVAFGAHLVVFEASASWSEAEPRGLVLRDDGDFAPIPMARTRGIIQLVEDAGLAVTSAKFWDPTVKRVYESGGVTFNVVFDSDQLERNV